MAKKGSAASKIRKRTLVAPQHDHVCRKELMTRGAPSVTRSIADAICIKSGNIFFVTESDGSLPISDGHGYGLYYHDCRYLDGYEFQIADAKPIVLAGTTGVMGAAAFELTNPHLELTGSRQLASGEIGISWERELDPAGLRLLDRISIKNYALTSVKFPVTFSFSAGFEDVFAVRGLVAEQPGKLLPAKWVQERLVFSYDGADSYSRHLTVGFSPKPDSRRTRAVTYHIALDRLETREIKISLAIREVRSEKQARPGSITVAGHRLSDPKLGKASPSSDWCEGWPEIQSDSLLLNDVIDRANRDLQSLWMSLRGHGFFAAGVPWFTTLFGRDSLITAMQMLPIKPEIAAETLRLLAMYQAREVDTARDAQPGKILHELRVGELASIGSIPHSPYYGTVDATPLFLILLDEYAAWTGDMSLFDELRKPVELALRWIDRFGDSDGDGYTDYRTASDQGLPNQGWKDSIDAILNSDGSFARPPIALVEVQGYVFRAKRGIARLFDLAGEPARAADLRASAETLRLNFNRDFWSDQLGTYYLALQSNRQPAAVVASNAGQALWSGIADPELARRTVQRLMARDMFSGWGLRTLSEREKGFNPIGYHVGSVWPHDNAIIVDGFRRYGFHDEALQVFMGILEAAMNFQEFQLPELFSGFSREQYSAPVHYPAACHPQAWAAGSITYMLFSLLGLEPHALEHTLEISHPMLPAQVNYLDIAGLHVGGLPVNVRFGRAADGRTVVKAIQADSRLRVNIR